MAIEITDGPGEFDLMLALFGRERPTFTFKVNGRQHRVKVHLIGLSQMYGVPNPWSVRGIIAYDGRLEEPFSAEYNSGTRNGINVVTKMWD